MGFKIKGELDDTGLTIIRTFIMFQPGLDGRGTKSWLSKM